MNNNRDMVIKERVEKFNDYSRFIAVANYQKAFNSKKIPDEKVFREVELPLVGGIDDLILEDSNVVYQYYAIHNRILRKLLEEIKKKHAPKMSEDNFNKMAACFVPILNIHIPPNISNIKDSWFKLLSNNSNKK